MSVVAVTGSETALLIMAAFWAVLVVVLCVVLIGSYNVLTSTKITIDTIHTCSPVAAIICITTMQSRPNNAIPTVSHIDSVM